MHLHFCKKYGLFFFFCLWPPSFTFPKAVVSCIVAPSFIPRSRCDFFCRQTFLIFPPFLCIYPSPFLHTPILISYEKGVQKLYYLSHSHKLNLTVKRKTKKSMKHQEISLVPYVQQPTEDAKNSFQYTSPATLLGLPLWKENFPIFFSPAHLSIDSYLNTEKSAHRSANWIYILTE